VTILYWRSASLTVAALSFFAGHVRDGQQLHDDDLGMHGAVSRRRRGVDRGLASTPQERVSKPRSLGSSARRLRVEPGSSNRTRAAALHVTARRAGPAAIACGSVEP